MKAYIDFLDEISGDELFEGLLAYGLFSERLPSMFSSENFYKFCLANPNSFSRNGDNGYVYFESMRNTCIPRPLGIPNPMRYAILCEELRDYWDDIRNVFRNNTYGDKYKISRIHIRKRTDNHGLFEMNYDLFDAPNEYDQIPTVPENQNSDSSLFQMNYKNWKEDGDPILDYSLGKKYVVKTDITQCFPSIYTHSIPWALVGKNNAKMNRRDNSKWYNKIDRACLKMRNSETHGLMIGPHASNLLSEIILTTVDKELRAKGYDYIRNIDDYTCYTETHEKAERFIIDLNYELRQYDLSINHKKTTIEDLPEVMSEQWVRTLKDKPLVGRFNVVDFNMARSYLDTAISEMKTNGNNASSLFYAIKVIGNKPTSPRAREYCVKTMCNLAIIYPYLVPIMDQYVFTVFKAAVKDIEAFANALLADSMRRGNYEGISYALYFALKYNFMIAIDVNSIIKSSSCICKLLLLVYSRKQGDAITEAVLINEAKSLNNTDFDENWIFIYEALSDAELNGEWRVIKAAGVSFLQAI